MDKNKNHVWETNMRALKLIHSLNPKLLPLTILKSIFGLLSPYVNLYMSAEIMNELAGNRDIDKLTMLVIITIGLNFIISVLNGLINKLYTDADNLFKENERLFITNKTLALGYAELENPDVQQLRREVLNAENISYGTSFGGHSNGIQRPMSLLGMLSESIIELILSSLLFSQLIAILIRNGIQPVYIIFAGAIAACMAVNIFFKFYVEKIQSNQKMDFNKLHSYGQRINSGLYSYNMGKDIRLYRLDKIVLKIKRDYMNMTVKANKDMEMFDFKTGIPESIISRIMQVCAYIFVCILAVGKIILIGDIIKYVGCLQRFLGGVKGIFEPVSRLKYNVQFLDNYFKFIDIPSEAEKSGSKKVDLSGGYEIELKNVSFKYPASENYALKNVSPDFIFSETFLSA
jgi:ATP-binding cassette subfamily B protein